MKLIIEKTLSEALLAQNGNNFGEAERLYRLILESQPYHPEANYQLGLLAISKNKILPALPLFRVAIESNPKRIEFWIGYLDALIRIERIADAKRILKQAKDRGAKGDDINKLEQRLISYESDRLEGNLQPKNSLHKRNLSKDKQRLLVNLLNEGAHEKVLEETSSLIQKYPSSSVLHNIQGVANYSIGKLNDAIKSYEKAIEIEPNSADTLNNLAVSQKLIGDINGAINSYKSAIKIKSDIPECYFNLGCLLQGKNELKEAKQYYQKAIEIWENLPQRIRPKIYQESVGHFAECMYCLSDMNELADYIKTVAITDQTNVRLAAISTFFANQTNERNFYPFCKSPLEMILISNISKHFSGYSQFINELIHDLVQVPQIWEPGQKGTHGGFQTASTIFDLEIKSIKKLSQILQLEIEEFRSKFKNSSSTFIKRWPQLNKLTGWYVRMLKGGYQDSHIHASGWLSGVVYLKTIPDPVDGEGAIEFSLNGNNYKVFKNEYPTMRHEPVMGDLILFPSSLYHRTIPYKQETERCIIAFDLTPLEP